jgi:pimeloyl-ACP methyl ester carboxylesterase
MNEFMIPFHDFGGNGPLLHFAHPNAYTPATFCQFLRPLTEQYRVTAVHHRPLWPHSHPDELTGWDIVTDDLIRFFEQQGWQQVIGVGHSLGAVTTAFAAVRRPDLFRALVLIEPVFLPPHFLEEIRANPGRASFSSFVEVALNRRCHWPSRQAAFDHFRPKRAYARWPDAALWDYVNESLRETENGVILAFPREWEARFYSRPPLDVWQVIPQLTQPTLAIRATESDTLFPDAWALWQEKQPDADFVEIAEVGHMLTLERPLLTAHNVLHFLDVLRTA